MDISEWNKKLFLWCKMKGYRMNSTYPNYRDTLFKILKQFPNLEQTKLIDIQEYAASIENDNTRKNTCVLIRWAFDVVLHKPIDYRDLPYPKRKKKIQPIYTTEEVTAIYSVIKNEKHRAILALILEQGLRVSEPCSILVADCKSKDRSIILRSCKGDNDRVIYPSEQWWKLLRTYWNTHGKNVLDKYLFEGQAKGTPYTETSIRAFIKSYCKLAKVQYKAVHSFRRYSITWGAENGISLGALADRSGHTTTRTIERHYLNHSSSYLKSVPSPLFEMCQ